jgi:hypothetical protein
MTPKEAKFKYCPLKPKFAYREGRFVPVPFLCDCKADGCMMWRWNYTPEFGTHSHNEYPNGNWQTDGDGYCGLGGKE